MCPKLRYWWTTWTLTKRIVKRYELLKNTAFCLEQIVEATFDKVAGVRLLTPHLTNHSSKMQKTYVAILEKQERIQKWCFLRDFYTWTCQLWPTSIDLHQMCTESGCSLKICQQRWIRGMEGMRKRVRELLSLEPWWWWWWFHWDSCFGIL